MFNGSIISQVVDLLQIPSKINTYPYITVRNGHTSLIEYVKPCKIVKIYNTPKKETKIINRYYINGNIAEINFVIYLESSKSNKYENPFGSHIPAKFEFYDSGEIKSLSYYDKGLFSNKNGPAIICWYKNGYIQSKEYFIINHDDFYGYHNNKHRPTYIQYYDNGIIKKESYRTDYQLHNKKGPAEKTYYKSGKIKKICYYIDGKLHNPKGPAKIEYDENGHVTYNGHYSHGNCYHEKYF